MTIATSEPVVVIRVTKTAGHQVIYVSASGRRAIRHRHLGYVDALRYGAMLARLHDCLLEVEP